MGYLCLVRVAVVSVSSGRRLVVCWGMVLPAVAVPLEQWGLLHRACMVLRCGRRPQSERAASVPG